VSEKTMVEDMEEHLVRDLSSARHDLEDFDSLPEPMKLIIIDFYYNKGNISKQKNFVSSIKERNAQLFKQAMMRKMPDRDAWTLEQFNKIPDNFWK
jgi:hypothetical protein